MRRRGGLRGGLVPAGRGELGRCGRPPALWRRGRLAGGGGREEGGGEGTSRAAAALALAVRRCTLSCVEVATEAAGGSSSGGGGGSISGSVGGSGAVECRRSLYDDVAREGATVAARDVVGRGGLGLVALKRISPGTLGWAWASASTVCCLPSRFSFGMKKAFSEGDTRASRDGKRFFTIWGLTVALLLAEILNGVQVFIPAHAGYCLLLLLLLFSGPASRRNEKTPG